MVKKCNICSYVGELTWRDGKYYCAMCGSEIAETDPVVQAQPQVQTRSTVVVNNVNCPICKNAANNQFDGEHYRCSLCGTTFDLQQAAQSQQYGQFTGETYHSRSGKIEELKKQKDRNIVIGVVCVFLFWPASIYFFYKAYQTNKELKAMGY